MIFNRPDMCVLMVLLVFLSKNQFNGNIYLTCSKKSQSYNLLRCVLFGNVAPVLVTAYKSLT